MKILKLPLSLSLLMLVGAFTSCNLNCLRGEGDVESRTLELARLSGVDVSGGTKVYISRGERQQVEVKGQANILNELKTDINGDGTWEIGFKQCLGNHETVEVYITVPELHTARVSGSGAVELQDVFESREFNAGVSGSGKVLLRLAAEKVSARISGSGTIHAAGVADVQDISISGSGKYNAYDLNSRTVQVDISGSGRAEVTAEEEMKADVSGSGQVYYAGNPSVSSDMSGSGKVMKR
ncbi:head GIN domain-containing protein [Pontibacter chinhatensis]|uniref:Putative auto-transporter adhesin, head GIN domain n=1 Tax=Pontibacter chinhatensis TaxID=1436961 RepID=A0A1I2WS56_9BACT|nr:head GIN domain-containing protein [Pontibacter chinhatensis]SFH03176.1 Putative auto-transporter adhesin, head GIN domain [Pontibacter chinhatensis]